MIGFRSGCVITGISPFLDQLAKVLFDLNRNAIIAQFSQQVAGAFDGVAIGKQHHVLQIFVGEMEVTTQTQTGSLANALPEIVEHPRQEFAVVTIAVVGVRRGDNMLDAVRNRHAAHFLGHVPRLRAVVHLGEDVAVDVDHVGFPKL